MHCSPQQWIWITEKQYMADVTDLARPLVFQGVFCTSSGSATPVWTCALLFFWQAVPQENGAALLHVLCIA